MFVFVFDESLFAFAYETPAFELALLLERYTTRADDDWGNLPFEGATFREEARALVYRLTSCSFIV